MALESGQSASSPKGWCVIFAGFVQCTVYSGLQELMARYRPPNLINLNPKAVTKP